MLDGVLVINELVDLAKRKKKDFLLFKVNFQKAYNYVACEYLRDTMGIMGFGRRLMRWMKSCVFSSSMYVLVNKSPTKVFKVERGLRKGYPFRFSVSPCG